MKLTEQGTEEYKLRVQNHTTCRGKITQQIRKTIGVILPEGNCLHALKKKLMKENGKERMFAKYA